MVAKLKPISKANYRIAVQGIEGYWLTATGFDESRSTFNYNDGQSNQIQEYPTGMVSKQPITLTKAFDPRTDWPLVDFFKDYCNEEGFTVTVEPINNCKTGERIGSKTMTYYGCQPIGIKGLDVDRMASDGSMVELRFVYEYSDPA